MDEQNYSDNTFKKVKAAVVISNPFDLLSSSIKLKKCGFGIFDYFLAKKLQ